MFTNLHRQVLTQQTFLWIFTNTINVAPFPGLSLDLDIFLHNMASIVVAKGVVIQPRHQWKSKLRPRFCVNDSSFRAYF